MLNALQKFVQGDQAGAYDLFSVALHEAGHTFGLDHSDVAGSAMNEDYHYVTSLASSDIAALRASTVRGRKTPSISAPTITSLPAPTPSHRWPGAVNSSPQPT